MTDTKEAPAKEFSIADLMSALEAQVKKTKDAQLKLDAADLAQHQAQAEYSKELAKFEGMKAEFNDRMGNIFPASSAVRVYN